MDTQSWDKTESLPGGGLSELRETGLDILECKREGPYVWDENGKRYIDCNCGAGTFNLGRRSPELIQALKDGVRETDQGNFPLVSEEKAMLAKTLADFVPGPLDCSVFSVVRGEAVDFACKVARGVTGRTELVTPDGGWYGQTGFALSLSQCSEQESFGPLIPDVRVMPWGDIGGAEGTIGSETAAVILEPIQAENHCRAADTDYLTALADLCRARGALLVLDETQTNFGRAGAKFAFEEIGVAPDVLVLGEALGGGMFPIAVTMMTPRVGRFMRRHPLIHLSTFGGSDIGCRVAMKALEIYDRERPWRNAEVMGRYLHHGIEKIAGQPDSAIRGVTGKGLLLSLDLATEDQAKAFCRHAVQNGLLVAPGQVAGDTVVLRPSLTISEDVAEAILKALSAAATATVTVTGAHGASE